MDDLNFEVKCRQYLIKRLGILQRDLKKVINNEKEKRNAKVEKLCKYKSLEEAREAYGYEEITIDDLYEISDVLESGVNFVEYTKTYKSAAFDILNDFISKQNQELRDFEWEMKSPAEQEQIMKKNEEFRMLHEEMKGIENIE